MLEIEKDNITYPFSKGIIARSMLPTGLPLDTIYEVAKEVRNSLKHRQDPVSTEEIHTQVAQILEERGLEKEKRRYSISRRIANLQKPFVILIGGTAGVGKSTIAAALTRRLGIHRHIGTDEIREIMRYMLYDTNTEQVPLSKEIEYLRSFIDLQRLRTKRADLIRFSLKGDPENHSIPPMLLIPFVENAFKHGSKRDEHTIFIEIECEKSKICFRAVNQISREAEKQKDITGGIGLQNVKRRLELLYPGKHTLEVKHSEKEFSIELMLENQKSKNLTA
ncbi:MAG: ATP cone domain-containing protein [Bacteroidota bacterium]